eukprot:CAMPEP_0197177236 /NCGR_PEP_ID=MMETSP1423-20130617/2921_1 /TAXON_ID=476441 /ORGANISM="Pseudo-nitzschia heimii, Strain UNC1101" /LENGTH=342 /DNA_ID=CAMNT_0042626759 /DNA_START=167 /DNA_END=1195 /DNA_ORIENTATION=-
MSSLTGMGIYAEGAILTFGMQFLGFAVAAALQTEVFYDILGGVNFLSLAFLAITTTAVVDGGGGNVLDTANGAVFLGLFVVSRGWLLVFLAWRAHDRKGDARFDGVRDVPSSFFVYWMVQAVWVYCISLPLLVGVAGATADDGEASSSSSSSATSSQSLASTGMLVGMAISILGEIHSDVVKTRWVGRGRPGGFCTEGLWKASRHPNYAGEILTWVFAAIYAALVRDRFRWTDALVAAVSPLFTVQILLNTPGTGVWNAEGKNLKRYYEHPDPDIARSYEEYHKTTPPVFPVPFVPYESIPPSIQRRVFFEWERYEYKPSSSASRGSLTSQDDRNLAGEQSM